jgi:nitrate/TMAO reductase-like tetraheme cytochrome c subunit
MMRLYGWLMDQWLAIGRRWRIALVSVVVLGFVGASAAGYRQWHYMQHDNRFCTTCHLMQDPYERFTRSAHAKLECHNCHQGKMSEQMRQLYATVVERPSAVKDHADVPNEVCGSCHVRGDSTRWKIIAATAGHRRHLESRDPRLRGMKCTDCHGVSVHIFAPVDGTCGQSGCHADKLVRLGKMGAVSELHCTTCHNFLANARTVSVDSLGRALTPTAWQCTSCHAMQVKLREMDISRDPHKGVCGNCHNPHTQATPQEISCTKGGCHAGWETKGFHIGVPHPERCTSCHQPHSWRVEGANCTRCHQNVPRQMTSPAPAHAAPAVAAAAPAPAAALPPFAHGKHQGQPCASCHSSTVRHGQLQVRSVADCQRCHHVGASRDQCATCHAPASLRQPLNTLSREFRLVATHTAARRSVPFEHARHLSVACTQCHTNPVSRAPEGADCSGCHASHHKPTAVCTTCHAGASTKAKHTVQAHGNCASAACHGQRAAGLPSTRETCLICHSVQARHMPGRACESCHGVSRTGAR